MNNNWFKARWNAFLDNIIWNLILAILVAAATVGTVVWAWLADWFSSERAPLTIPLVLGAFAFSIAIADRVSRYRSQTLFRPLSSEALRLTIQQWLKEYGFTILELPPNDELEKSKYDWDFFATFESITLHVAFDPAESMITTSTYYIVLENWEVEFDRMTSDIELGLLDEVIIELAHFEVGYDGIRHPLRQIIINDQILYDETFSKLGFVEKAKHVLFARSAADAIIRRAGLRFLGKTTPASPSTPPATDTPAPDESTSQPLLKLDLRDQVDFFNRTDGAITSLSTESAGQNAVLYSECYADVVAERRSKIEIAEVVVDGIHCQGIDPDNRPEYWGHAKQIGVELPIGGPSLLEVGFDVPDDIAGGMHLVKIRVYANQQWNESEERPIEFPSQKSK